MIKARCIIFVLLTCVGMAEARLGEMRGKCDKRYGAPVKVEEAENGAKCIYMKADFEITVEFARRKSIFPSRRLVATKLTYRKPTRVDLQQSAPLTEGELKTLLGANMGKSRWREVDMYVEAARTSDVDKRVRLLRDADNFTIWSRDDGTQAVHDQSQHTLTVRTQTSSGHKTLGTDSDLSGF